MYNFQCQCGHVEVIKSFGNVEPNMYWAVDCRKCRKIIAQGKYDDLCDIEKNNTLLRSIMTNDELKDMVKLTLQARAKRRPELYKEDEVCAGCKGQHKALAKKFNDEMINICQDAVDSDNYNVLVPKLAQLIKDYEKGVE